ncbi:XdhC family protein [bacterium SCSIO 12696]|nr:XdhC family protein [bacterium SCSIO 12696]
MANRLNQILTIWSESKDSLQWVLATIVATDGSSYRKAGAMMLINSLGKYHGLLSGGCLESDIMRQARRCWETGYSRIIEYDMREETDVSWQLGIGCGGMVRILLQPVSADNNYLELMELQRHSQQRQPCIYRQKIFQGFPESAVLQPVDAPQLANRKVLLDADSSMLYQQVRPTPHLAVFGGGVDATPVVELAATLGWHISLFDPRAGYARAAYFPGAQQVIHQSYLELSGHGAVADIDAAVVMHHNVELDAQAIQLLQQSPVKYLGLLGPAHRTERVLQAAGLSKNDLKLPLANPVGLRLGGELPESIALAMVAEIHAVLEGTDGLSISGLLSQGGE